MIANFRDHAANERTYLAWIRTAVALMAFGFVIEKFDLFVRFITHGHGGSQGGVGRAGVAMLVVGLAIVALASWGFLWNRRLIDTPEAHAYQAVWPNLALGTVVAALGVYLIVHVVAAL